jgi:hypothetical protein
VKEKNVPQLLLLLLLLPLLMLPALIVVIVIGLVLRWRGCVSQERPMSRDDSLVVVVGVVVLGGVYG